MEKSNEANVVDTYERIVDAGPDGFMPHLVEELKNIFGEGNYVYDGYEIGKDEFKIFEFNLYFFIKESLYESLLKKVKLWSELMDLENSFPGTPNLSVMSKCEYIMWIF